MLESSTSNFDQSFRTSIHQDQQIIQLLLSDQVTFLLSNKDSLTYFKKLFSIWEFFIHDPLGNSIEDNSNESTNSDDDRCIETNDTHAKCISEKSTDNLFIIQQNN